MILPVSLAQTFHHDPTQHQQQHRTVQLIWAPETLYPYPRLHVPTPACMPINLQDIWTQYQSDFHSIDFHSEYLWYSPPNAQIYELAQARTT